MKDFKTGVYKHYKGKKYLVLSIAKHSETMDDLVVYICLYENTRTPQHTWVRPLSMFDDIVEFEGEKVKRFEYIGGF